MNETEPVSLLLGYVDFADQSTQRFVREFFPFCVTMAIDPFDARRIKSTKQKNRALAEYVERVVKLSRHLQDVASAVRAHTSGNNLTPLLLPVRNFRSGALRKYFERLFFGLSAARDPYDELAQIVAAILAAHPWVHPPGGTQRCLCDGRLYFKSPGKARHGYFHHQRNAVHRQSCLLSAKSRLGAAYSHNFHFDCTPVRGALSPEYPNCHDANTRPPARTHVNIAPTDYIF